MTLTEQELDAVVLRARLSYAQELAMRLWGIKDSKRVHAGFDEDGVFVVRRDKIAVISVCPLSDNPEITVRAAEAMLRTALELRKKLA